MGATLKSAVIGCGFIGARHIEAVTNSPHATFVAGCDTDASRSVFAERAGGRFYASVEKMLAEEKPDVVTIATPDHLHFEPTLRALEAGCHVFCEKPLAMTLEHARAMNAAAAKAGKQLAVDYNRRYAFGYSKAHALVAQGSIGKVTHASFLVTDGIPAFVRGRGAYAFLFSMLTHHIDLMRWFCGEVVSVHTRCSREDDEGKFLDMTLSFEFASGAIGSIAGGWREGQKRTIEKLEIGGVGGAIQIEDVQKRVRLHLLDPDTVQEFQPSYFWGENTEFYHSLDAHVATFLREIAAGEPVSVSGAHGERGLEIVEAAIESHQTGRSIAV